ncbi:allatostatin-A receptor-like [Diadema antillarum]|uniref:allatostatin-A receptor-like n=1 Tax=Diadema antillarum TaxID=105358 RepID=UPI003A8554B7
MEMNSTTSFDESGFEMNLSVVSIIVFSIFGLLGIGGNGLVLLVIAKVKELRDITNILIANQSLIDFTSSVLLIANFVVPLPPLCDNIVLARFICGFWYTQYSFWSTYAGSVLNLTMLTTERYLAIVHAIQYRRNASSRPARLCVLLPWMAGFMYMSYLPSITKVEDGMCYRFLWKSDTMQRALGITTFITLFVSPLTLMTLMYVAILRVLREQTKFYADGLSSIHQKTNYRDRARRNVIRTMMCLSVSFCICFSPNCILYFVYCLGVPVDLEGVFYYVTVCIAFINIWINPFVYALQYRKFQRGLKQVFGCSPPENQESTNMPTVTVNMETLSS